MRFSMEHFHCRRTYWIWAVTGKEEKYKLCEEFWMVKKFEDIDDETEYLG